MIPRLLRVSYWAVFELAPRARDAGPCPGWSRIRVTGGTKVLEHSAASRELLSTLFVLHWQFAAAYYMTSAPLHPGEHGRVLTRSQDLTRTE
jgi:hypothetical protein